MALASSSTYVPTRRAHPLRGSSTFLMAAFIHIHALVFIHRYMYKNWPTQQLPLPAKKHFFSPPSRDSLTRDWSECIYMGCLRISKGRHEQPTNECRTRDALQVHHHLISGNEANQTPKALFGQIYIHFVHSALERLCTTPHKGKMRPRRRRRARGADAFFVREFRPFARLELWCVLTARPEMCEICHKVVLVTNMKLETQIKFGLCQAFHYIFLASLTPLCAFPSQNFKDKYERLTAALKVKNIIWYFPQWLLQTVYANPRME
jgi:hypothetical protein